MTLATGPCILSGAAADLNTTIAGERLLPGQSDEIEIDHLHRYVLLSPLCAGRDVLDIATKQAHGWAILGQQARSVVGIDIHNGTVARARTHHSKHNPGLRAGTCCALPAQDRSFDVVVCFETIEHIIEQDKFLAEVRRVLREDGILVISIVTNGQIQKPLSHDFHELTRNDFEEMLKKVFGHVAFSSQRMVLGSALMTEGSEQGALVFANQGTDRLVNVSYTLPDASNLIAVCSNTAAPASLGNSFFQGLFKASHFSALQSGIRERDKKILALRDQLRSMQNGDRQRDQMPAQKFEEVEWLRQQLQSREKELSRFREQIREFTTDLSSQQQHASANEVGWLRQQIQDREKEVNRLRVQIQELTANLVSQSEPVSTGEVEWLRRQLHGRERKIARLVKQMITSHGTDMRVMEEQLTATRQILEVALRGSWSEMIRSVWRRGNEMARFLPFWARQARRLAGRVKRRLHSYSPTVRWNAKLLRASGLFDERYYLARSPDLAQCRINLIVHYLIAGAAEGRDPHPLFSTSYYLAKHPEVGKAGLNPLIHFIKVGAAKGWDPHPLFDIAYYLERNELATSDAFNPLIHYLTVAGAASRDPHPLFSSSHYVRQNRDVAESGINPLMHYLEYGAAEGRNPHPGFNSANYVARHPEAAGAPLIHYLRASELDSEHGAEEFDHAFYRSWNHDPRAQRDPVRDYLTRFVNPEPGGQPLANLEKLVAMANEAGTVTTEEKEPVVSIIVPVHNQVFYTLNCLVSLRQQETRYSYEILVVDDCSTDQTAKLIPLVAGVRYLRNERNLGFLRSCNRAASEAYGQYFLFLNNDTCVLPGWLDELMQVFDAVPGAGLVGSKLIYPNGKLQEAGGIIFSDGSGWNYGRCDNRHKSEYNYMREVDYCSGASIVVPRHLWKQLDGFDEGYAPAYYEDADLAFRIRDAGYKVLYQPLSQLVHFEGVSCGTDTSKGVKAYQVVNARTFAARHEKQLAGQCRPGISAEIARDRENLGRVLFIDAETPTPDRDAGSVVTLELMRTFQQVGYQPVFMASDLEAPKQYADDLRRRGVEVLHRPLIMSLDDHLKRAGRNYAVVMLFREGVATAYMETIRRLAPQAKVIFHTIDLHHVREQRQAQLCRSQAMAAVANITKVRELAMVEASDATIVVSQYEKDYLTAAVPGSNVTWFPFVKDVVGSRKSYGERSGILFVGGYRHPPNVDAVSMFAKQIFPTIRAALPEIRLLVLGSNPPPEVLALNGNGVEVIGYVPDLAPYLDRCRLTVAPLRFGAGIKGKVVDSMSFGVPSVISSVAAEGMGLCNGREVLIADRDEEFADAVVRLYTDEKVWHHLSAEGLAFVDRMYSRSAARKHVRDMLASVGLAPSEEESHSIKAEPVHNTRNRAA